MRLRFFISAFLMAALVPGVAFGVEPPPSGSERLLAQFLAEATRYANSVPLSEQTVGNLATKTGMSNAGVMAGIATMWSRIKLTGVTTIRGGLSGGPLAACVQSLLVGTADHESQRFFNYLYGEPAFYKADGTKYEPGLLSTWFLGGAPAPWDQFGEDKWYMVEVGGLVGDDVPEGLEWRFAGSDASSHTVTPVSLLDYLPGAFFSLRLNNLDGPEATDREFKVWWYVVEHLMNPGVSGTGLETYYQGSFTYGTVTMNNVGWYRYNSGVYVNRVQARNLNAAALLSIGNWLDANIVGWEITVAAVPGTVPLVPMPREGAPGSYEFGPGLDGNSTVQDVLDALGVPNILPFIPSTDPNPGDGTNPGTEESGTVTAWFDEFFPRVGTMVRNTVEVSPDAFKDRVLPEVAGMRLEGEDRWPFAGAKVISAVTAPLITGGADDGMEWYVDCSPPVVNGINAGQVGVWIRPLQWLDPFKPYRWVGVAGVALGLIVGLYNLLRPKVHV